MVYIVYACMYLCVCVPPNVLCIIVHNLHNFQPMAVNLGGGSDTWESLYFNYRGRVVDLMSA